MVLGSSAAEVQKVVESRDLPGMAGFDEELKRMAARRRRTNATVHQLPSGRRFFG